MVTVKARVGDLDAEDLAGLVCTEPHVTAGGTPLVWRGRGCNHRAPPWQGWTIYLNTLLTNIQSYAEV